MFIIKISKGGGDVYYRTIIANCQASAISYEIVSKQKPLILQKFESNSKRITVCNMYTPFCSSYISIIFSV
jgi:hypothetical protein